MKRIVRTLLILSVIYSLMAIPAWAASDTYTIPEMDLSVSIPSSYDVFTRNMSSNDPLLLEYGISHSDLLDQLASGGTYLDAVAPDGSEEIVVTMEENIFSDFNGLGDTTLLALASALKDEFADSGLSVSSYDIYHHPQLTFIRIFFNTPDKTTYGLHYCTSYNSKAMNFTMRSYAGPFSEAQENVIRSVVDSINLHSYIPTTAPVKETPAFVYTDNDTGTTFTIPANWTEEDFGEEREYLDAKFSFADDPGLLIMYGSTDLWSELSFIERLFVSRATADELMFSFDDSEAYGIISEMYGIPESSISKKTYGEKTYYLFEQPYASDLYGISLSTTLTQAWCIENGWGYIFQFGGKTNNQHFDDFEKVLQSVEFGNKGASNSGAFVIIIIVLAIIAGIVIIIRKKKSLQKAESTASPAKEPLVSSPSPEYIYCHRCGNKLPTDSSFCISCGTRLIEKESDQ